MLCERCKRRDSTGLALWPFTQLCVECYIEIVARLGKSLRDAASLVH
jgi:hypothetical protein